MRVLLVTAVLLMAGCATPLDEPLAQAVESVELPDPSQLGNLTHATVNWDLGVTWMLGSQGAYPIELYGEATVPDGDGPFPIVLMMHGRHATCSYAPGAIGFEFLGAVCPRAPPAVEPVDSYTGYQYLAEYLASHGVAAISINANNVNDHDLTMSVAGDDSGATARGRLVHRVINEIDSGNIGAFASKIDLESIGLMGHSRGGEGVAAASTMQGSHDIDAVFALAPTDFARWVVPEEVAFATILPYCDGDVSNLQGAWMYDDKAGIKHQFLHMGANHNFYNTVWTGDDWGTGGDPYCGSAEENSGRLTMEEQKLEGMAIMGTFFRHYLTDAVWLPALDGRVQIADALVSYDPGTRHLEDDWHYGATVDACSGFNCPIPETYSTAPQRYANLGETNLELSGMPWHEGDWLTVRVGIHQDTEPDDLARVELYIEDETTIHAWNLTDIGAFVPPGDGAAKTTLNMVRVSLAGVGTADTVGFRSPVSVEIQAADWIVV